MCQPPILICMEQNAKARGHEALSGWWCQGESLWDKMRRMERWGGWHHLGGCGGWGGQRWGSDISKGLRNGLMGLVDPRAPGRWSWVIRRWSEVAGRWSQVTRRWSQLTRRWFWGPGESFGWPRGAHTACGAALPGEGLHPCGLAAGTCHRDLGTWGWGCAGSLGQDITCALVLWIPVGGHEVCPHPGVWDAVASSWDGDINYLYSVWPKTRLQCGRQDVSAPHAHPLTMLGPAQPSSPPTASPAATSPG